LRWRCTTPCQSRQHGPPAVGECIVRRAQRTSRHGSRHATRRHRHHHRAQRDPQVRLAERNRPLCLGRRLRCGEQRPRSTPRSASEASRLRRRTNLQVQH
jgi:hypothetical protein